MRRRNVNIRGGTVKRRVVFLKDPTTINIVRKRLLGAQGPHKATIIGAVNQLVDHPERRSAIMNALEPGERSVVGGIVSVIGRNRLNPNNFIRK